MEEETGGALIFLGVWLLTICSLTYNIIEEATNRNPHDKPFPWQSCYWLCLVLGIPIALAFVSLFPILLLPIVSSAALGYFQYTKEDREQRRQSEARFENLIKKHPDLLEAPPLRPSFCKCDQFRVFDIDYSDPGYLGLASRKDIEYLARLFRRVRTHFGYQRNDYMLFLGSLKDDTYPEFIEVLGESDDIDEYGDRLLGPKILKSEVSPDLYQLISRRLIDHGRMCLRWTE